MTGQNSAVPGQLAVCCIVGKGDGLARIQAAVTIQIGSKLNGGRRRRTDAQPRHAGRVIAGHHQVSDHHLQAASDRFVHFDHLVLTLVMIGLDEKDRYHGPDNRHRNHQSDQQLNDGEAIFQPPVFKGFIFNRCGYDGCLIIYLSVVDLEFPFQFHVTATSMIFMFVSVVSSTVVVRV